jgi:hypothetical protein
MITLDLRQRQISLDEILNAVDQDTVVIIRQDGKRLLLEAEDAFAQEVATLGQSEKFMALLAERTGKPGSISLEAFEEQLAEEERRVRQVDTGLEER